MSDAVNIQTFKDVDVAGYTLIEGFPGIGLIGTIAVGYLNEKVKAENVGFIMSKKFPPMASIHKGTPVFPARIYVDKKHKLVLLFSEFVIPSEIVFDIAEEIFLWARKNKVARIVSLAGMTSRKAGGPAQVYGIASTPAVAQDLTSHGVKLITEGITTGVSGILMAKCGMEKVPAMSLLVETERGYPDPGAAAELLEMLEKFLGFDIKTQDLLKEAEGIEKRMKSMLDQVKVGKMKYKQAEEHLPMYG
jgi:uncharacterized protein